MDYCFARVLEEVQLWLPQIRQGFQTYQNRMAELLLLGKLTSCPLALQMEEVYLAALFLRIACQ
jgi:hypothetical protein